MILSPCCEEKENRTEMIVQMQSGQHLCGDKKPSLSGQWFRGDLENLQGNMLHGLGCDMFYFFLPSLFTFSMWFEFLACRLL